MSSPRLRAQFESLFEHFKGNDSDIRLEDITDVLFCTRRNARIVLNKLADEGWIEWLPAAGRGNLSRLNFKRNQQDVSENLARRYLEEGKIEQALNVLDKDAVKLTQVIQSYLGIQYVEGKQVIRLPYYRPLSMLNPLKPNRRSEQNIINQIFSGLTTLDDKEQLQPDLAHTWEAISPKHWRFYLRSGVRFHNGNRLKMEHVIQSIESLTRSKLYAHITRVESPKPWVLDVHLTSDDLHLPLLFAESTAKIVSPEAWINEDYDLLPIGSGPYKVEINNEKRLILEAFDGYFGYRPLVDSVEVWVINETYSSMVFPSLSNPIKPVNPRYNEVELDPGCTYLLLNRKDGLAKNDAWAKYFSVALNSFNLFKQLPEQIIIDMGLLPAYGLKPGWYHSTPYQTGVNPPSKEKVTIAYHSEHPVFPTLAKSIAHILSQAGLTVEFVKYQHDIEQCSSIDIWLKPMGIATYRDDALVGWLLDYSGIFSFSGDEQYEHWHFLVEQWRLQEGLPFPAKALGKSLVENHQIIPMFHCWLGVSQDHCGTLQNAKCNALGWFDFSQVWVKPEVEL